MVKLRSAISYWRVYNAAKRLCELINVGDQIDHSSKTKRRETRKRMAPASLLGSALDLFITNSADADPCRSTVD